jgi:hypothetical protein
MRLDEIKVLKTFISIVNHIFFDDVFDVFEIFYSFVNVFKIIHITKVIGRTLCSSDS